MRRLVVFAVALLSAYAVTQGSMAQSAGNAGGRTAMFAKQSYPDAPYAYLDLAVTYVAHAETQWHDDAAGAGGYWGPGIDEPNKNGAVRGMCNTMLGYASVVNALDAEWLRPAQKDVLTSAGLNREKLIQQIRGNLEHIVAHHKSAAKPLKPEWGQDWQSSLWLGAAGCAVMLVWNDIPASLQEQFKAIVRAEADRIDANPVRTYRPGNTAAEENAWDMHAPALAFALDPEHTSATAYFKTLCRYAANTYSVPADRTSAATIGDYKVSEFVTTENLFDDFTLDNHGFFHPDYVQVSGQHLGESRVILELGDRIHGTAHAARFEPFEMHHVKDVWDNVMKPLVLPNGELAFPSGNDWTYHCSINQSYLAFIGLTLGDSLALQAEKLAIVPALKRREVSPQGRILGDTNLEWWWEPLLIKRCTTALLNHLVRKPAPVLKDGPTDLKSATWTRTFPDSKIWIHRNPNYFVSVSWGKQKMGVFIPFGNGEVTRPYVTMPLEKGIVPETITDVIDSAEGRMILGTRDGGKLVLMYDPVSVTWISSDPMRPIAIENHAFSGGKRKVAYGTSLSEIPFGGKPKRIKSSWFNIDDQVTLMGEAEYVTEGKLNRKSAAYDRIIPSAETRIWKMTANQTAEAARKFVTLLGEESVAGKNAAEYMSFITADWSTTGTPYTMEKPSE